MSAPSSQLMKICDYEIRTLTTEDKPMVFEFVKKFFFTAEPLNEALNLAGRGMLQKLSPENCPMNYLSEKLSLMAVTPSGETIGVVLNEEVTSKNSYESGDENQIRKLLNYVGEQMTKLGRLGDNEKEMEVRAVTVHADWRNKGVGGKLLEKSRELAQEKGFMQMRSICTSAYTARMFVSCGFEYIYSLKYKDCKEEGRIDFLPQEPHTHIKGMILKF